MNFALVGLKSSILWREFNATKELWNGDELSIWQSGRVSGANEEVGMKIGEVDCRLLLG